MLELEFHRIMNGGMGSHDWMFGNQCVNMMNNILTYHFTDYSLKQKIAEPLFFHMDRDFILDVRERCDRI